MFGATLFSLEGSGLSVCHISGQRKLNQSKHSSSILHLQCIIAGALESLEYHFYYLMRLLHV